MASSLEWSTTWRIWAMRPAARSTDLALLRLFMLVIPSPQSWAGSPCWMSSPKFS